MASPKLLAVTALVALFAGLANADDYVYPSQYYPSPSPYSPPPSPYSPPPSPYSPPPSPYSPSASPSPYSPSPSPYSPSPSPYMSPSPKPYASPPMKKELTCKEIEVQVKVLSMEQVDKKTVKVVISLPKVEEEEKAEGIYGLLNPYATQKKTRRVEGIKVVLEKKEKLMVFVAGVEEDQITLFIDGMKLKKAPFIVLEIEDKAIKGQAFPKQMFAAKEAKKGEQMSVCVVGKAAKKAAKAAAKAAKKGMAQQEELEETKICCVLVMIEVPGKKGKEAAKKGYAAKVYPSPSPYASPSPYPSPYPSPSASPSYPSPSPMYPSPSPSPSPMYPSPSPSPSPMYPSPSPSRSPKSPPPYPW